HGTNIRSPLRVGIAEPQCTTRTRDKWPSARKPIRSVAISVVKPVLSHFFKVAVLGQYPVSFLQQQVWEECKQTSQNTDRRYPQLVNCMQKAVASLLGGCTAQQFVEVLTRHNIDYGHFLSTGFANDHTGQVFDHHVRSM